jgi:hypothetical protein
MKPIEFDFFPNDTVYNADCKLINMLTDRLVYNFKTKGYQGSKTNVLTGGDNIFENQWGDD